MESRNRIAALEQRLEGAERRSAAAVRRARGTAVLALVVIAGLLTLSGQSGVQAQGGGSTSLTQRLEALESRVAALQAENATLKSQVAQLREKTKYVSTGTDSSGKAALFITGVNVYIQDGSGSTASGSGLGNLIIGYNALRDHPSFPDARTGTHNLVLGDYQNYTSYGGLVAGQFNAISGAYASVSGGGGNTASASLATVSGGVLNTAGGYGASVSGGKSNTASAGYASVGGGENNTAGGPYASVSGGQNIEQGALWGWSAGSWGTDSVTGNFRSP